MDNMDKGNKMDEKEEKYLTEIEQVIERFGTIQRNFVLDKTGVRAIINFIEQFEGHRPFFELDDPVVEKGRAAAFKVMEELSRQLEYLKNMEYPPVWEKFHKTLVDSIRIQLEGYREMTKVFEDCNLKHVEEGRDLVNQGMNLLQGGKKEG